MTYLKNSLVKKAIKESGMRSSPGFLAALDRYVDLQIKKGIQQAKNEGRKTLNETDTSEGGKY